MSVSYRYIKLTVTRRRGVILVVDNTTNIAFDSYRYTTANDAEARDPVSWYVAGSPDGNVWTLLDSRTGETITASRTTNTSTYTLPGGAVSYRYIKWSIFDTKTASTGTVQFSEFVLMSGGSPVAWNGAAAATNPGGNSGGSESPAQAIDSNTATKMLANTSAGTSNCQLSEFTLMAGASTVAWNAGCVETNPGGTPAGGEGADNLTDGSSATKWNDTTFAAATQNVIGSSVLKFDNTTGITFDGYRFTTANDDAYRDPSTWKLEGSNDDSIYSTLDERFGESLPAARTTNSVVYALPAASGAAVARKYPRFPNKGRSRKAYAPYQVGFRQGIAAFAGATFTQDLSGTLTSSATLLKLTSTAKTAAMTSAGSLIKQTSRALTGSMASAATLLKQTRKVLAASLSSSATLAALKTALLSLTATMASSGALTKRTGKILAASMASSTVIVRQARPTLSASLPSSSTLTKRTSRALTAAMASSATLQAIKTVLIALTATMASSGTLSKRTLKVTAATMGSSASVVRRTSKLLNAALASAGTLTKRTARALSAVLSFIGALTAFTGFVQVTTRLFTARVESLRFRADKEQRRFVADTERRKFEAK